VQAFSKFLYNENIKNLISKEKKWFKDYTETKDYPGYYPYERAMNFYKDIKKLGKFEDETNYFDKFREIISAVGNCLGFIRLLRSASLNSSSKLIEYLPNKQEIG
jgi:WASH complex subunit 7